MAIYSYQTDNGETLWRIYVNVRSKIIPEFRSQRKVSGLKSEKEAEREETKLIRECEREVYEKESHGQTWGAVVAAFEEELRTTLSDSLQATTNSTMWPRFGNTPCTGGEDQRGASPKKK